MLDKAQFDDVADGIGLSVGASALRAVAVGRSAVTRSPVLTLYPHRPPEVGVPSENPNLAERGLIITNFVDRVGDPVAIIAADGSSHRAEGVLADALGSLLNALTGGRVPAEPIGVTHPAHWAPPAVEALRGALTAQPGLHGREPALLVSDAVAALTALQDDPGLPTRGVIALCDVGGTGASITLADAANGCAPIGPTVRYPDFSGDLIDQALLSHVVGDLAGSGSVDLSSTSAIGNLSRLRGQCRGAKERLSTAAVTSLPVELPGYRTEVRITRAELDDAIRGPLEGFVDVLSDTLQRNGIRPADLVAAAAVGGGSRIPILVTTLSEYLRVPVITSAQPELAAAIGVGVTAARSLVPDGATAMAPAAAVPAAVPPPDSAAPQSSTFRALAWSDAEDIPEPVAAAESADQYEPHDAYDPRPQLAFTEPDDDAEAAAAAVPFYRRPLGIVLVAVIAVLAALAVGAYYLWRDDDSSTPATTPTSASTTPPTTSSTPQPGSEAPPPGTQAPEQTVYEQAPPPATVTEAPPPVTETPPPATETAPPTTETPPPTTSEAPPPSTVTVTETPTQTSTAPSSQQQVIPPLPYQTIPGLPFVPAPIQPASP